MMEEQTTPAKNVCICSDNCEGGVCKNTLMCKLKNPSLGLLLFRLAVGAVFVAHGFSKWQGIEGTIGFFGSLGLAPFFAYAVATVELVGGLMLILGLYTRVAALLLAGVMAGAIFFAKGLDNLSGQGGYEYELVLFTGSLALLLIGGGRFSLLNKGKHKHYC